MSKNLQKTLRASLLVAFSLICETQCQMLHRLKYINAGTHPPVTSPAQFDSSQMEMALSNARNRFAKADRICVAGMWALYNTTDFGRGVEDVTTVISVRGTDIGTACTRSGQLPILRNVQSLNYLGGMDYSQDGVVIYSQPYFLGGRWNVMSVPMLPAGITGFPLASLAITGTNSWLFCGGDRDACTNGVCVDMRNFGNLFMLRNAFRDNSVPNGWPKTVRHVMMVSRDECLNYQSPPQPSTKRGARATSVNQPGDIEVEVDIYP